MNDEWIIETLRNTDEPEPRVPAGGVQTILNAVRRRRRVRVVATSLAVAAIVSAPVAYAATRSSTGTPVNDPAQVAAQAPSANASVSVPDDLVKELGGMGYDLTTPPVGTVPVITPTQALAASRAFVSDDKVGLPILYVASSPDIGDLSDPSDPQSKVIPLFDKTLVWAVVFNVTAPKYGNQPEGAATPSDNPMVPATVTVFVDATTGKALRASLF